MKKYLQSKDKNLSGWYNDVVLKAQLADYSPVKGCMVIRPYGFSLWQNVKQYLGKLIKDRGVEDAYFPLFIPESFLKKEKEHLKGFSPQLAVVTFAGGSELSEKLIIRPTSETIMYAMFKKWAQSYRDLPLLLNQWCNVVRWEQRTYLFLRTTEFLWQEGHCAHVTHKESTEQVLWALNAYQQTYKNLMAMYGIAGFKSESEKFAGAGQTYSFECLMPNGKALQAATSHDLGQNFAKSFDWYVQDDKGKKLFPWQNSWGFSTRSIGGLIMVHGDENGLVIPPQIAPIQIVIIPIPGQPLAQKFARNLEKKLQKKFRVKIDTVDNESAGFKYNKWEVKGVPVRLEIGNKEVKNSQVTIFRRDTLKKTTASSQNLSTHLTRLLKDIQTNLFEKHQKFTQDHTSTVDSYQEFRQIMNTNRGFILAHWCENPECEAKIKEETKATTRCLPLDAKKQTGKCVFCSKPSHHRWLFAQSY